MAVEVKVGIDAKEFHAGVKKMRTGMKSFAGNVGKFAGAGAVVAVIGKGFKDAYGQVMKLSKAVQGTGADFKEFQKINTAAEKLGVSTSTVTGAMKQLKAGIFEAQAGTGKFAEVFKVLGINADAMAAIPIEDQFRAISNSISGADEATQAWALDKLGGDLENMASLILKGGAAVDEMTAGTLQVSEETKASLAKVNSYWIDVKTVVTTVFAAVMSFAVDAINYIVNIWTVGITEVGGLFSTLGSLIAAVFSGEFSDAKKFFKQLKGGGVDAVGKLAKAYKDFGEEAEKANDKAGKGGAGGKTPQQMEADKKATEEAAKAATKAAEKRKKEAKEIAALQGKIAGEKDKQSEAGLEGEDLKSKLLKDEEAQRKKIADIEGKALDDAEISHEESKSILQAQIELEKIRGKIAKTEQGIKDKSGKKEAKDAQDALDAAAENADLESQIADEKDKRSEIGLSETELIDKAKGEELSLEQDLANLTKDANADGIVDAKEKKGILSKELELEGKRSEIAGLIDGLPKPEDTESANAQTSIISSALASIGGGGGSAIVSSDPLLNENKRQTQVLERIAQSLQANGSTSLPEI